MSILNRRLLVPVAAAAALFTACATEVAETGLPVGADGLGSAATPGSRLVVLSEFEGSYDPETGELSFTPVALEGDALRTAEQALWCQRTVQRDTDPNSGPANTVELYTIPGSIASSPAGDPPNASCVTRGGNGVLYGVDGVFCADVRLTNDYPTLLDDSWVVIDIVGGDEAAYAPYTYPLGTGGDRPASLTPGVVAYTSIDGAWTYGDLNTRPAAGSAQTVTWTFRYGQAGGGFRFRGKVVAAFAEVCGDALDNDCDGVIDNGCGTFGVGAVCATNSDCTSNFCNAGFCAGDPCSDTVQNAGETDVDCGGPVCGATCAVGDLCGGPGDCASGFCRGGTCQQYARPSAEGQLVITEFMAQPTNSNAEWFEVFNTTPEPLDLNGCSILDVSSAGNPVEWPLAGAGYVVPPGDYFVLAEPGAVSELVVAGLAPEQFEPFGTSSFGLGSDTDGITIRCDGVDIDVVSYDDTVVDIVNVAESAQLDARSFTSAGNDNPRNFCAPPIGLFQEYAISAGQPQYGTPGFANIDCTDWTVGFCNIQFPTSPTTGFADATVTYYGRVYAAGLTDQNTSNNPDNRLTARVGLGTIGTDPDSDASWTWTDMVPNPAYTAPGSFPDSNNDEYWGDLQLPSVSGGPFEVAIAFSGDGGNTWTYCDQDGSSTGGYTSAQAGRVTVLAPLGAPTNPGDVIFTEVMVNSWGGTENGEFVELHNPTGTSFNLAGCRLIDDNTFTFPATIIPAGGYVTVGKAAGQGYTPTVVWSALGLANGGDDLELRCDGAALGAPGAIDSLSIPGAAEAEGRTLQLRPDRIGSAGNGATVSFGGQTLLEYWCQAPVSDNGGIRDTSYGIADGQLAFGTPNAANVACLGIDYCRLDAPTSLLEVAVGSTHDVNAQYYSQGVTDQGNGVEPHHMLRVQHGMGSSLTDPSSDASWVWTDAAEIPGWDGSAAGEPNNDGFRGTLTAPADPNQTRDFAFRVSGDSGLSWTYCDRVNGGSNGSADGYQASNAGKLSTPLTWSVTACNLQYPNGINDDLGGAIKRVGDTRTIYGRVRIDGLTDQSAGPNTSGNVIVQLGYGPDGSARSSWTYANASANAGFSDGTYDEYEYTLTIPTAANAPYDYGYRVSGDGGTTWTDCAGTGDMPVGTFLPQWGITSTATDPGGLFAGGLVSATGRSWNGFSSPPPAPNADVLAQFGFGLRGTDPRSHASWQWTAGTYVNATGNDWNWSVLAPVPATPGTYSGMWRYSGNGGATWLYADNNGPTWNPSGNTANEASFTVGAPVAGSLVITEILQNPGSALPDPAGEWFEVYNPNGFAIELGGNLSVASANDILPYEPAAPLQILAHEYFVFARQANSLNPSGSGSAVPDAVYGSTLALGNGAGSLTLTLGGVVVDKVAWDGGPLFPDPDGKSMSLTAPGADNSAGASWCEATTQWDGPAYDYGTPGLDNPACAVPPLPAGALVITEIYYAAPSGEAEWVEVYNASAATIDFSANPIEITDGTNVAGPVNSGTVAAGGYFTIGNSAVAGFTPDATVTWGAGVGFLSASGDTVTVRNGGAGTTIDTVTFASWGNSANSGRSLQLDIDALAGDNTLQANWCGGLVDYDTSGTTQLGSPGAINHTCAVDCTTGEDDDFDGVEDCSEPACSVAPGCAAPPVAGPWRFCFVGGAFTAETGDATFTSTRTAGLAGGESNFPGCPASSSGSAYNVNGWPGSQDPAQQYHRISFPSLPAGTYTVRWWMRRSSIGPQGLYIRGVAGTHTEGPAATANLHGPIVVPTSGTSFSRTISVPTTGTYNLYFVPVSPGSPSGTFRIDSLEITQQ